MGRDLPHLEDMDKSVSFLEDNGHGRIRFKEAFYSINGGPRHMSVGARACLGLTELCMEQRLGRFYHFVSHPNSQQDRKRFDAFLGFRAVPEVFYVPEVWTEQDVTEWQESTPHARHHRLCGRHGLVPDWTPILPIAIDLADDKTKKKGPQPPVLDGFTECLVTIYLGQRPYIGLTEEMRKACRRVWKATKRGIPSDTSMRSDFTKWSAATKWDAQTGRRLVQEVDKMYWHGMKDYECVIFYYTLVQRFVAASKNAVEKGQPYCLIGEDSNWLS